MPPLRPGPTRLAPHQRGRQGRHGDYRPDSIRNGTGPCSAAGHDRGPLHVGVLHVAARPTAGLVRPRHLVAMDGFTGFKTATSQELPHANAVTDPFHVVRVRRC